MFEIMLRQITLPSFFGQTTAAQAAPARNAARRSKNDERRAEIMKILNQAGRRMGYGEISEETGWTMFSLRNLINRLESDGKVIRSRDSDGKAMVESASLVKASYGRENDARK